MQKFMICRGITIQTLLRLTYFLKEKKFRRRDYVYKEGDLADGIHFIKSGEFQVSTTIVVANPDATASAVSTPQIKKKSLEKHQEMAISIMGPFELIGFEELSKEPARRKTKV